MFKKFFVFSICFFVFNLTNAQDKVWSSVNITNFIPKFNSIKKNNYSVKHARYFKLNKSLLLSKLSIAAKRKDKIKSNSILEIPNPNGGFESYELFEVQTLSPKLALKYPHIKSYVGKSKDADDASVLRMTITSNGVFAMILKPDIGQVFINPYIEKENIYTFFLKSDVPQKNDYRCEVDKFISQKNPININKQKSLVDDSQLRVYDMALACTGEYAEFQINQAGLSTAPEAQQIATVLSAMTVTMDRVNSIYERDLGVSMQLDENTDKLIFLNASEDPYDNTNGSLMLDQNQTVTDSIIGNENYDIGHVLSTGGGGVAYLGVVCNNSLKAGGVTGSTSPIGDPFDIDFVSHEIGHQFGANHTQNNDCQRNLSTAVEPGSASTIMGYAGICPPNIQSNSDAYFHKVSIDQIFSNISIGTASSCGIFTTQTNTAPIITPLQNYTIPNGTAFFLDVEAVDNQNDNLTYNWEQIDNTPSPQPPISNSKTGPNFRSLPSKNESIRYFPNFSSVLNNNLEPLWEVIPTVSRTMNFSVTVRDNNILVGQSSNEQTTVTFADTGPFEVTSQNVVDLNWIPGDNETISWNVAGTTANGINTTYVNILLSTDGGQNFDTVLLTNTPNDGSEDIVVPSIQAPFCRIMVKPVDNIYYAINSAEFAIDTVVNTVCDNFSNLTSVDIPDGLGTSVPQTDNVVTSVINIPEDFENIQDVSVSLDVSHTFISDLTFQLLSPNGELIDLWDENCNSEDGFSITFNDAGNQLPSRGSICDNPLTGNFTPMDTNIDLASLFSSNTAGNWILIFRDSWLFDVGTLNSWEIEICTATFSVDDEIVNDFSITPNPNSGIFNLTLSNPVDEDIKISVYDMNGRLIENIKLFSNALSYDVVLQSQYKSGIYLLNIESGNKSSVKKLIIK